MNDTEVKLKGVKQVLLSEFREAEEMDALKGYLWFVRENEYTYTNSIYLGSKLYGTAEIRTSFENFITNIVSTDNIFTVTKASSPEGTTVNIGISVNPDGGLVVTENGISIDTTNLATKEQFDTLNNNLVTSINTINENVANGFNTINQNVADGFNTINGAIENEIRPGISEAKEMAQNEEKRAMEAEDEIKEEIVSEINRATEAETNLQTNINVETNERKLDVSSLQNNINVETNERKLDVSSLQNNINAETNERKESIESLNSSLSEEIERAKAAESDLSSKIENGSTEVSQAIQDEVDRATAAESDLNKRIDEEVLPEVEKSVKYTDVSTEEMPSRKAIVLENHDLLLGKTTDGSSYNLAMVSKWNKADFGSAQIEINLNGSAERPTYNDSKSFAFIDDVNSISESIDSIKLEKDADNELLYKLYVGDKVCGEINIPKDQFLKEVSYDAETNNLKFVFVTTNGEAETLINLSDLIKTYTNGYGINLDSNVFSIKLSEDEETSSYLSLSENGLALTGINDIKNSITVKYLGNFNNSGDAEAEAAKQAYTANNALFTYTVNNTSNGIIVNNIINNENVKQYLYLAGKKYTRDIKLNEVSDWSEDSTVFLASKGVTSYYLFSLTTASTQDDIQKALTYKNIQLTVNDLDKCIVNGYTLIDEMYDQVKVGFDGQAYTFTKIGRMNPKNNVYACSATLSYSSETSEFSVKNDSVKYVIASNNDISTVNSSIESIKTDLLSLSGYVDTNTSSISNLSGNVQTNADNIAAISGKVEANETNIATISGGVQTNADNISSLSGKVEANETNIATVSGKVEANETNIATVSGNVQTNADNISSLSGKVEANETNIATISGKVDTNIAAISEINNTISQIGTITENVNKLQSDLTAISETVTEVNETKIPNIESRISSVEKFNNDIAISGITLNNGVSYKARPNGEVESPIDLLTLDLSNEVLVGSNIGKLNLISKGRPVAVIDGNEGSEIALLSDVNSENITNDINSNSANIASILDRLTIIDQKISDLSKTNVEAVTISSGTTDSYDDTSKDYVMNGDFQKSFNINGNSVSIKNASVTDDSRITISAQKDVELSDTNFSGDFPKSTANAVLKVQNSEYVTIKNVTFDATLYNAIEIGLSGSILPKGVLFDNCKFMGDFSNNAILIFGTDKDAVININNCQFQKVSNMLRLSNKTNTTCTVNITNCSVEQWDTTSPWQGMVIMQDYTSAADKVVENNLFGPDKITINVINCTGPNGKISQPNSIAEVCGTGDDKQIFYVWSESGGLVQYSEDRYPKITIV